MSLTGIRDVDMQILLNLDDSELPRVCAVNKYVNKLCEHDDFWYRRIIDKIAKAKEYNFSKVKDLIDIQITGERIKEMQEYFGFEKLKELNDFMNKLPRNSLYQVYMFFKEYDKSINAIYSINIDTSVFPKYIDRKELINELRRCFVISYYKPIDNKNLFNFESLEFILTGRRIQNGEDTFNILKKMGVYDKSK